jgi:hypothetical protein
MSPPVGVGLADSSSSVRVANLKSRLERARVSRCPKNRALVQDVELVEGSPVELSWRSVESSCRAESSKTYL